MMVTGAYRPKADVQWHQGTITLWPQMTTFGLIMTGVKNSDSCPIGTPTSGGLKLWLPNIQEAVSAATFVMKW